MERSVGINPGFIKNQEIASAHGIRLQWDFKKRLAKTIQLFAEIKNITVEEISCVTTMNAEKIFKPVSYDLPV